MRAIFGIVSLVVVLLIVASLVKKQMAGTIVPVQTLPTPATPNSAATTQREQVQQLQQQIKQTLDAQMQAPRDLPSDAK